MKIDNFLQASGYFFSTETAWIGGGVGLINGGFECSGAVILVFKH